MKESERQLLEWFVNLPLEWKLHLHAYAHTINDILQEQYTPEAELSSEEIANIRSFLK